MRYYPEWLEAEAAHTTKAATAQPTSVDLRYILEEGMNQNKCAMLNRDTKAVQLWGYAATYLASFAIIALVGCVATRPVTVNPTRAATIAPLPIASRSMALIEADAPAIRLLDAAAPTAESADPVVGSQGKLTLAWDASPSPEVIGYRLYYTTNQSNYTQYANVGNSTQATVIGLIEGTRYYFRATAYDALGVESVPSNEVSGVPPIYIYLAQHAWAVTAYGMAGKTNEIQMSTNLVNWTPILTFVGNGTARTVLHTNQARASFRVVVR